MTALAERASPSNNMVGPDEAAGSPSATGRGLGFLPFCSQCAVSEDFAALVSPRRPLGVAEEMLARPAGLPDLSALRN
jgi:hypothetical protein